MQSLYRHCCCRLTTAFQKLLLGLLACEEHCHLLLAGGHAVKLVQRLATLLDQCIAREGADKGLGRDSGTLDVLLQVPQHTALHAHQNFHAPCLAVIL